MDDSQLYVLDPSGCTSIYNEQGQPWTENDGRNSYRRLLSTNDLEYYGGAIVTARKSTGGPAPRKQLAVEVQNDKSQSPLPSSSPPLLLLPTSSFTTLTSYTHLTSPPQLSRLLYTSPCCVLTSSTSCMVITWLTCSNNKGEESRREAKTVSSLH